MAILDESSLTLTEIANIAKSAENRKKKSNCMETSCQKLNRSVQNSIQIGAKRFAKSFLYCQISFL